MSHPLLRRSVIAALILLVSFAAGSAAPAASIPVRGNNELVLTPPSFVAVAQAQEAQDAQEAVDGFPQDEAGMSAYFRAPFPITLATVRPVFRTVEYEDSNYIIGSVAVPDYPESEDVHVYVHRDGWFLAYYLAGDSSGKIIDWRLYHNSNNLSTKLESALSVVALPVGVTPSGVNFYDFRYPNANRLLFVADWFYTSNASSDPFQVNLPIDFSYFERSWSIAGTDIARLSLNGQEIGFTNCAWCTAQGTLTPLQLPPSQNHTFLVRYGGCCLGRYVYGGLVLIYRVP